MTLYTGNALEMRTIAISGSTPVGLDLGEELAVSAITATVEGGDVRVSISPDAPSHTTGHLQPDGSQFSVVGAANVRNLQIIATVAETGATLTVSILHGGHGL